MKWMQKYRKPVDERQELGILKVERKAFWILFISLTVGLMAKVILFDVGILEMLPMIIPLFIVAVWMTVGHHRNGTWDIEYIAQPSIKVYLIFGIIPSIILTVLIGLMWYFRFGIYLNDSIRYLLFFLVGSYVLCFFICFISGEVTKRRRKTLEKQYADKDANKNIAE
ncbi:MAG: hypothetical protein FWC71_03830 [Defluviitaleaceae bacterium]|nr:hypothetical protein [Defluviitaleaceae bacterium]